MSLKPITRLCLASLILLAGGFALSRMPVSSDIRQFLPKEAHKEQVFLSSLLADSEWARTIILNIEAENEDNAAAAAQAMAEALREHPDVETVQSGIDITWIDSFENLYLPRTLYFLSDHPEQELPTKLSAAGLQTTLNTLRTKLSEPTAFLTRRFAQHDPWLIAQKRLELLAQNTQNNLRTHHGQFVTTNGQHGVVFITARKSPFSGGDHAELLQAIHRAFEKAKSVGATKLWQSNPYRFSATAETQIRQDITRISIATSVLLAALLFVLLGSFKQVVLVFLPSFVGMACASLFSAFVFQELGGMTLAFGFAMIGVSVDYAVHILNHHSFANRNALDSANSTLSEVWRGLALGAGTTLAGLLALLFAPFPGMTQLVCFAAVGILTALLSTRWLIPPFLAAYQQPTLFQKKLSDILESIFARWQKQKALSVAVLLGLFGLALLGLPRLKWEDQLMALSPLDPALLAEDQRVRERVSKFSTGQLIAVFGDTEEEALQKNDAVALKMKNSPHLDGFHSLHHFLWSKKLQLANLHQVQAQDHVADYFQHALEKTGFSADAFANTLAAPTRSPLSYVDLKNSALAPLVQAFYQTWNEQTVLLSFVRKIHNLDAVRAELSSLPGVFVFDQNSFLTSTYQHYRKRTLLLVGLGLPLVFLLILLVYRNGRRSLAAFLPALFVAVATLGFLGLFGIKANLMHFIALLLITSLSVDYGVFLVEHAEGRHILPSALLSTAVACLTTAVSFGSLLFSKNPALQSLGLAVGVGSILAFFVAPLLVSWLSDKSNVAS